MTFLEMMRKVRAELPGAQYCSLSVNGRPIDYDGEFHRVEFTLYVGKYAGRDSSIHASGSTLDEVIAEAKVALANQHRESLARAKRLREEAERLEAEAAALAKKGVA